MGPSIVVEKAWNMSQEKNPQSVSESQKHVENLSRRQALKGLATGAVAAVAMGIGASEAEAHEGDGPLGAELKNPYGGKPGGGMTLAEYFRPTKYMTGSNANYFPLSEELGPDEMRISFCGSTPFPPRLDQAGTFIMVELFRFRLGLPPQHYRDAGPGSVDQRHFHFAPARRPLRRHPLLVSVSGLVGRVHAFANSWPLWANARTWNSGNGRRNAADVEMAPGGI